MRARSGGAYLASQQFELAMRGGHGGAAVDASHGLGLLEVDIALAIMAMGVAAVAVWGIHLPLGTLVLMIVMVAVVVGTVLASRTVHAAISNATLAILCVAPTFAKCLAPLVVEDLDLPTIHKVMIVGLVDMAPHASALPGGVYLLLITPRLGPWWFTHLGLRRQDRLRSALFVSARGFVLVGVRLMPCLGLGSFGAFVRHSKQLGHGLDVVGAEFLQHPLIMDAMAEGDDDGLGRDLGDGVAHLAIALNELPQRFTLGLNDGMEVTFHTRALEGALEVSHELVAEVFPRVDLAPGKVHEP